MAEKKCKHCAMMIPAEAKVCPYCRKRQPSKAVPWLILIIVLLFGYTCSHQGPPSPSQTTVNSTQEVALTDKGKKLKAKHPEWNNDDCNTAADHKIHVGMTTDQVKYAWGKPYKINITSGASGDHEQWVMYDGGDTYVYFDNGIMTSLQQSK